MPLDLSSSLMKTEESSVSDNPVKSILTYGILGKPQSQFLRTEGSLKEAVKTDLKSVAALDVKAGEALSKTTQELFPIIKPIIDSVGKGDVKPLVDFAKQRYEDLTREIDLSDPNEIAKIKDDITNLVIGSVSPSGEMKPAQELIKKTINTAIPGVEKTTVRLGRVPTPVKEFAEKVIEMKPVEVLTQRRGVMSDAELRRLASGEINVLDKLAEAKPGTVLRAEEILAAKEEMADRILNSVVLTEEEIGKLSKAVIGKAGVAAESGRAVRAYGVPVSRASEIIKKIDQQISETVNPIVKNQLEEIKNVLVGREKTPGLIDMLVEWATAIKLTNFRTTPVRATLGNAFGTLIKLPERLVSSVLNPIIAKSFRAVGRTGVRDRFAQDAIAEVIGWGQGLKQAGRNAVKSLLDESYAASQQRGAEAIPIGGAIPGKLGKIIRFPFRVISAPDAFFRTLSTKGSEYSLATRQALKEGLSGEKLVNRIDELTKGNPEIELAAKTEGSVSVFQDELGKLFKKINDARNMIPGSKLLIPFFKTPIKLMKFALDRSPLGIVTQSPQLVQAIKSNNIGEITDIMSRITVGTGIITGLYQYAQEGNITGSWSDLNKAEKDAKYRQGEQPFSVKIGNRWYSYRGFEPLSSYLTWAARLAETQKEPLEDRVAKILFSLAEDFANQPFLLGLSGLMDALDDPENYGPAFIKNFVAGNVVPTGISDLARLNDTTLRDRPDLVSELKSRIPGLSDELVPQRNVFGEPIQKEGSLLRRLSPVSSTDIKNDQVDKELERLEIIVGFPSNIFRGIKLDNQEMDTLLSLSGKTVKATLNNLIKTPEYQALPDQKKTNVINNLVRDARDMVKNKMLFEVILTRLNSPDEDVRNKLLNEELPKLFKGASRQEKELIIKLIKTSE